MLTAAGESAGRTVWYTWTAPVTGRATVRVTSFRSLSPWVGVYRGSALSALQVIGTGKELISFDAQAGTAYQIVVDGSSTGPTGGFELIVSQ